MSGTKGSDLTEVTPALGDGVILVDGFGGTPASSISTLQSVMDLFEANTELATSRITSGTFADARIAASNVTQHQTSLSLTESQISDLGTLAVLTSDIGVTVQAYDATILNAADIGSSVQGYNVDTLFADTGDNLTAGFTATSYNAGTQSGGTYTPNALNGNLQYATNGGAHTLAPPSADSSICLLYTNNASAGAITTSGFDQVTGDSFTTTDTHQFMCAISVVNGVSLLAVTAMQ